MKTFKALTLMAQLVLAFHGDVHPLHDEFHYELRRSSAAIVR